jgi:alpha-glucosidase (family GH31 glycosyl hydrolase)
VGAVDIDSGWSTGFNNFVVDTSKFPDMKSLVDQAHAAGARVILWATSMVDTDSSNFGEMTAGNYCITVRRIACIGPRLPLSLPHTHTRVRSSRPIAQNATGGQQTLKWWHGRGLLVDYTNPAALSWWHAQLDRVLALGIDGWKVDGTDPYIIEYLDAQSAGGPISYRQYADLYYGDFFNYTRSRLGDDRLIMSRPVDSYGAQALGLDGYLPFSPRYTVLSGWVGDQDPTWDGLQAALRNMVVSAWSCYVNYGCDIGGYRSGTTRTPELFSRWFQLGAFLPLMENGGDNEHRPWMYDQPGSTNVTDRYRRYVNAHLELLPYLLTTGSDALDSGCSALTPALAAPSAQPLVVERAYFTTFNYMLGPDMLIAPITQPADASGTSRVSISFPAGSDWVEYLPPYRTFAGGSANVTYECDIESFPVFQRKGAILPLYVASPHVGHGDGSEHELGMLRPGTEALTLLVHGPASAAERRVREFKVEGLHASYESDAAARTLTLRTTAFGVRPVRWLIRGARVHGEVSVASSSSGAGSAMQRLESAPADGTARGYRVVDPPAGSGLPGPDIWVYLGDAIAAEEVAILGVSAA